MILTLDQTEAAIDGALARVRTIECNRLPLLCWTRASIWLPLGVKMIAVFCAQKLPLGRHTVRLAFEWDHRCNGYQRRCI